MRCAPWNAARAAWARALRAPTPPHDRAWAAHARKQCLRRSLVCTVRVAATDILAAVCQPASSGRSASRRGARHAAVVRQTANACASWRWRPMAAAAPCWSRNSAALRAKDAQPQNAACRRAATPRSSDTRLRLVRRRARAKTAPQPCNTFAADRWRCAFAAVSSCACESCTARAKARSVLRARRFAAKASAAATPALPSSASSVSCHTLNTAGMRRGGAAGGKENVKPAVGVGVGNASRSGVGSESTLSSSAALSSKLSRCVFSDMRASGVRAVVRGASRCDETLGGDSGSSCCGPSSHASAATSSAARSAACRASNRRTRSTVWQPGLKVGEGSASHDSCAAPASGVVARVGARSPP